MDRSRDGGALVNGSDRLADDYHRALMQPNPKRFRYDADSDLYTLTEDDMTTKIVATMADDSWSGDERGFAHKVLADVEATCHVHQLTACSFLIEGFSDDTREQVEAALDAHPQVEWYADENRIAYRALVGDRNAIADDVWAHVGTFDSAEDADLAIAGDRARGLLTRVVVAVRQ